MGHAIYFIHVQLLKKTFSVSGVMNIDLKEDTVVFQVILVLNCAVGDEDVLIVVVSGVLLFH